MEEGKGREDEEEDLKEKKDWILKDEVLCCTLWRSHFGRDYGPGV